MKILKALQSALNKYMMYRIDNGAYKFFVRKLEARPDIDLAADILTSDYFRHNLKPLPLETEPLKRVIVFAPHQDDETIGCGGLLTHLAEAGCDIHIVFLTDGENRSGSMKAIRHEEAAEVCRRLGATMHEIGISNVTLEVGKEQLEAIASLLDRYRPDALLMTWLLDAPPIHRLCNAVLCRALRRDAQWKDLPVLAYQVHTALIPNVYFEYTDRFAAKQDLIRTYASQMADQNYAHLSAGLDAWNTRLLSWSPEERYAELYTQLPAEAYCALLESFYPRDLRQTFKGHQACIDAFERLSIVDTP